MIIDNPDSSLLCEKELFIFDMDGTIYLGSRVFDFAIKFINELRAHGKKVLFFTNNASKSTDFYLEKLQRLGFGASESEVMTAGDVTKVFLKRYRAGKSVYLLATEEKLILLHGALSVSAHGETDRASVHIAAWKETEYEEIPIAELKDFKVEELLSGGRLTAKRKQGGSNRIGRGPLCSFPVAL